MNKTSQADLKIQHPCRTQVEMNFFSLDDKIPYNHKARAVWAFVDEMDLTVLYEAVRSRKDSVGRKAVSPKVFLALWLYGLTEGTFSARKIARECTENDAYRWIAGGANVNRNNISSFRSQHPAALRKLLTQSLALMLKYHLLGEEDFSQDGTRIQAAAGFNTFRTEATINGIERAMDQLISDIEEREKRAKGDEEQAHLRKQKEQAEKRRERARIAAEELVKYKATLEENAKKNRGSDRLQPRLDKARASMVDPEARKMKMGDGSFRLAYNVQFSTGVKSRIIYGVDVVNTLDPGTLTPMISKVMHQLSYLGKPAPKYWIADAAYSSKNDLNSAYELYPELKVIAPPNQKLEQAKKEKKNDSTAVRRWRRLLDTEEFREAYKQRCSTAEFSNMLTKAKGMGRVFVRTIPKVTSMCLLYAISFNMMRFWDLMA